MRVNYNWLRDYVDVDLSPPDLAERLTMVGLEVEELTDRYEYLDKVVVAEIESVQEVLGSKHLKRCMVRTDSTSFQVVCGAPNVAPGMLSALALVGAQLPDGLKVAEEEIRKVRSTGMLCSEAELIVGPDAAGVISLDKSARPGQSLKKALGLEDWIFEIGVTPNRPDCLCVLGVAREAAGILGRKLKYPQIQIKETSEKIEDLTSVQILDPDHCPRYVARVITGVAIGPSPFWMVDRLAAVGVRPINNIVDITNFVLMETGQPLHAFDMDRLEEGRIVVKTVEEGDRFATLDKTERIMGAETLMICDANRQVALAGIMGGLNSEIVNQTTNVLLESAYFNPVSIRRTSKNLGLSTEASFRFERGIDPDGCVIAANRAAALMAELAGGQVAAGVIDAHPKPQKKVSLGFSPTRCNHFLGTDFTPKDMVSSLKGIEIEVSGRGEDLRVEVPTFRVDLTREVDLFEEAARLIGFDQVPATLPAARAEPEPQNPSRLLKNQATAILEGLGLAETITYSFISERFGDKLNLPEDDERRRAVRILNPLTEEQALMRTTLVPGLLDTLRRNQAHNVWDAGLFEVGRVFLLQEGQDLPEERLAAAALLAGSSADTSWHAKPEPVDFFDIKGAAEDLLQGLNVSGTVFDREACPVYYDQSAAARISAGGRVLGAVGRLSAPAAGAFDLKEAPFIFELDLDSILAVREGVRRFTPLPRFPLVGRDLAVVLDKEVEAARVYDFILGLGQEYLTDVILFDAYEGPQVGQGKKSLAFRLLYRSYDRTLTDLEVNNIHEKVTDKVLAAFSARLRS